MNDLETGINMSDYIEKEEYEEPQCLLNMKQGAVSVAVDRVLYKLDEYLNRNDYVSAEKHLKYWISEAESVGDDRAKLTLLNEQIGLYRKLRREDECLKAAEAALALTETLGMNGSIVSATTLLNSATGYKAFGKAEKGLPLYENAKDIYERFLDKDDPRLGGLYNNMALALTDLRRFDEAEASYAKAIEIMKLQEHGEAEIAVTYVNMADMEASRLGLEAAEEKIKEYLMKAYELLNTDSLPRDGHYAFVCEKCAPAFGYSGFFVIEEELKARAEAIYKSN